MWLSHWPEIRDLELKPDWNQSITQQPCLYCPMSATCTPPFWWFHNLPKQGHQLGNKCSNIWASRRQFHFKPFHALKQNTWLVGENVNTLVLSHSWKNTRLWVHVPHGAVWEMNAGNKEGGENEVESHLPFRCSKLNISHLAVVVVLLLYKYLWDSQVEDIVLYIVDR